MKTAACLFAVLAPLAGAFGATYYSAASGSNGAWSKAITWKTAEGSDTSEKPAEGDGHVWVLQNGSKVTASIALPATTWYMGSDGNVLPKKSIYTQSFGNITFEIPSCTVYGCRLYVNSAGTLTLKGTYTFVPVDGQTFRMYGNDTTGDGRHLTFDSAFSAVADAGVTLELPMVRGVDGTSFVTVNGDFGAFKGQLVASQTDNAGMTELRLLSATAMGDATSPRTDAVVIKARTKLVIGPDVVQSADRGVTFDLNAGETAYIGTEGEAIHASTVTCPLYGSTGTLIKNDPGTVTLAGTVEMKDLVVREGKLVLAQTVHLPADAVVTVEEGAELVYSASILGRFTIQGAGVKTLLPIEVGETPVVLEEGFDPGEARVAVTHAFELPLNAATRAEVLQIPNGSLSVDALVDATEKTGGLPVTHFESETVGGVQKIYLVARAAIAHVAGDKQRITSMDEGTIWTDGKAPHADADYFHIDGIAGGANANLRLGSGVNGGAFDLSAMGTLTLRERALEDYMSQVNLGHMRAMAGSALRVIYSTSIKDGDALWRHVLGDIYIDSEATLENPFSICLATLTHEKTENVVEAKIRGEGVLRLYAENKESTTASPSVLRLTGDNSELKGRVVVQGYGTNDSGSRVRYPLMVSIADVKALGGDPVVFAQDGVYLQANTEGEAILQVEKSTTADSETRGWLVDHGTVRTAEGATLTLRSPLRVVNSMVKDGSGTLALGAAVPVESHGSDLKIKEGCLMPLTSDCCTRFDVFFSKGTGIAIDADVADETVRQKGLTARNITLDAGVDTVRVELRNWEDRPGEAHVRRAIVTAKVDAETGKTVFDDRIELIGRAVKTLTSELSADGATRTYFADYAKPGLIIVFR